MGLEYENWSLIVGPMLCNLMSFVKNERIGNDWLDYFSLVCFMVIRFMFAVGFMYHLSRPTKG